MKQTTFDIGIFCYTIYNMRFKTLFTLSTSVAASALLCWGGVKKQQKTPVNAGKFSTVQTLKICSDTIRVSDSNFNHISKTAAAGCCIPFSTDGHRRACQTFLQHEQSNETAGSAARV